MGKKLNRVNLFVLHELLNVMYHVRLTVLLAVARRILGADVEFEGKPLRITDFKSQSDGKRRVPPPPVAAIRSSTKTPSVEANSDISIDISQAGDLRKHSITPGSSPRQTDCAAGDLNLPKQPDANEQLEKTLCKPAEKVALDVAQELISNKQTSQREFKVIDQKLKLLQRLYSTKKTVYNYDLSFDFVRGVAVLRVTDGDLNQIERSIHETLADFAGRRVNLKIDVEVFFSETGRLEWLDSWIQQSYPQIVAVAYVESSHLHLMTADEDTATQATQLLETSLTSETVPIKDCHMAFVKTKTGSEVIGSLQSECSSVRIAIDKREIVVDGKTDVVESTCAQILQLLKKNSKIDQPLPLTPAEYKVLKCHEADIIRCATEANSSSSIR